MTQPAPTPDESIAAKLQAENQRLVAEVDYLTLTAHARDALEMHGGSTVGLLPHVLPRLKVVRDSRGNRSIGVTDVADSNKIDPTLSVDSLIASMKSRRALAPLFGGVGQLDAGRVVSLTAAQAKDPVQYQRLKARLARGEIDGATGPDGRWVLRK